MRHLDQLPRVRAALSSGGAPVMLRRACYDGYYVNPTPRLGTDAAGEVITRADGKRAVASWSATGLGVATGHDYLNRGFLEALLVDEVSTLGEATMAGKLNLWATGNNLDLLDTYLLFGDSASQPPLSPTAVELLSFTATGEKKAIVFNWETASELDNLGFNLYRADAIDGQRTKLNEALIPTLLPPGSVFGARYEYRDDDKSLKRNRTYYYWLEDVDLYGGAGLNGPVSASPGK